MKFLSQASDLVLLRASERCGLLLAPQFRRSADRLAAIRRRLDEVRDAESSGEWTGAEDEDAAIRRGLRKLAFRDTTDMTPTDRRTTAETLRTLAVMNQRSRARNERAKGAITKIERPAEFDVERPMDTRSILPEGPTPQEHAEHAALAERARPVRTFDERIRQQAFAEQERHQAQYERQLQQSLRVAARYAAHAVHYRPEDRPRDIGMPGIGGFGRNVGVDSNDGPTPFGYRR